jgi:tRNA(Ile)-lysidine synthase
VAFNQAGLATISRGLRRNLIRRAAESLRPDDRDFGFDALERAAAFAETPSGKQVDFVNGLYLFTEAGKIYLAAYEADLPSEGWPQVLQLSVMSGPRLELSGGWVLTVEQVDPSKMDDGRLHDNWSVWLDADRVMADTLIVRPRRAGDQFSPLGMARQTIKLREFFINVKLPRRARANWPLVCAGDDIVWVPGFRLAHPFRITDQTRRALHLEIKRLPKT